MVFSDILKTSSLPRLETEILMGFLLKKNREFLLTHPETKITPEIFRKFQNLTKKRLAGWSIAVLSGEKEFYSDDVAYIYKRSKDIMDEKVKWRQDNNDFDNIIVKFKILSELPLVIGSKITGRLKLVSSLHIVVMLYM